MTARARSRHKKRQCSSIGAPTATGRPISMWDYGENSSAGLSADASVGTGTSASDSRSSRQAVSNGSWTSDSVWPPKRLLTGFIIAVMVVILLAKSRYIGTKHRGRKGGMRKRLLYQRKSHQKLNSNTGLTAVSMVSRPRRISRLTQTRTQTRDKTLV